MVERTNSKLLFDHAQLLLVQSDSAKAKGQLEEAHILLSRSARLHEDVFRLTPNTRPRTQAIVGRTAAGLYFHVGDFENAARMAQLCLDTVRVPEKPEVLVNSLIYEGAHLEVIWEDACQKLGRPHPTSDFQL